MQIRTNSVIRSLAIGLLCALLPGSGMITVLPAVSAEENPVPAIESHQLNKSIHLAAGYLIGQVNANGKFVYRINLNPAVQPKPKYNFLRHAGTIYALASYDRAYPAGKTKKAIGLAANFLKNAAIYPLPDSEDMLAVWSHPNITGSGKPLQAKLGGTGLGLVALLSVEKIMPQTTPLEYLQKMGNFIVYMQKPDGSFYSKYIPDKGGRDDSWTSLYYPGEAALGLLMLYEIDPSVKWLQAAAECIAYLARKRKEAKLVEADHWALLATARLLPLYDRCRKPLPRQEIEHHAVQICRSILKTRPVKYDDPIRIGGFAADGRTTPTAIRLEGFLAALGYLSPDLSELRRKIAAAVGAGLQFLLRSQIRSGEHAGAVPRAIQVLPENHPLFNKSFNRRATEVRIDYVQHALSAMLQYEQMHK